jgi:hypothetical protein
LRLRAVLVSALVLLLGACASAQVPGTLSPFSTDGCSMFPDRSLLSGADWCRCCVAHDLVYWRGGTAEERLEADQALRSCVQQATGNTALAELMYAGVRTGGGPYFYTPYRWAYGWPYGRGYEPLSSEERAQVSALQTQYLSSRPVLTCEK